MSDTNIETRYEIALTRAEAVLACELLRTAAINASVTRAALRARLRMSTPAFAEAINQRIEEHSQRIDEALKLQARIASAHGLTQFATMPRVQP